MTRVRLPLWLAIPGAVLVVVVLANALTFLVAEQRRATQLQAERFEALAGRLTAFADLYRRLPEMDRAQLERIAQVRGERVVVQGRPRVGADRERDPRLEARLRAGMNLDHEADIRVARRGRPSFNVFEPRRAQQQERLVVAVRLGPDAWLNADFHWPVGEPVLPGLVLSACVSGVVLVGLGLWLGRRLSVPLEALAHAAERLHAGQQVVPVAARGPFSLRDTVTAFNRMAQRLVPLVDSQKLVLASVGHDLRTPITVLRLKSEFIEDEGLRQSFAGSLDEIEALTEAALRAVRGGVGHEAACVVDVSMVVAHVCEDLRVLGHDVAFSGVTGADLSCRPAEIRRAARNLIENAVRHAGAAQVRVEASARAVTIHIEDEGPGIADDALEAVFRPFERLGQEQVPGHGLGLTLARAIARAHGGDVILRNRSGGGLRATLVLPRAA